MKYPREFEEWDIILKAHTNTGSYLAIQIQQTRHKLVL